MTKILLLDDDESYAQDVLEKNLRLAVGAAPKITRVTDTKDEKLLTAELKILHERQMSYGKKISQQASVFDTADVVIVDYDLRKLADSAGLLNGEEVARRLRRYTTCGPIVSLNRNGRRIYNLRLQDPPGAGADVSVAEEDLACKGLWHTSWTKGYRPWTWPALIEMSVRFKQRVKFCEKNWPRNIADALGVPEPVRRLMPGEVTRFGTDLLEMTFQKLAAELVPPKEVEALPVKLKARVVASFLGSWLEHTVLPSQETIIDAPHLVRLFPSLFTGARKTKTELNKLATLDTSSPLPLDEDLIASHATGLEIWTNRRTWWTSQVMMEEEVAEVADPSSEMELRYVFCEDSSRFQDRNDVLAVPARGLFSLRFVEGPERLGLNDDSYQPKALLAQ